MLLIDPWPLLASLLLALVLDALLGDPAWLWRRLPHPVVAIGRLTQALEARWLDPAASGAAQRRRGCAASLLVIAASVAVAVVLQEICRRLPQGWLLRRVC